MRNDRYLIVRFVENLARGEARNIGVFLEGRHGVMARFLGEKPKGGLDLRTVRSLVPHTQTYKQWIEYWRRLVSEQKDPETLLNEVKNSARGNFVAEEGHLIFIPREMDESDDSRLQYLFNLLVADFPIYGQEDLLEQSLTEKCDEIIKRYELRRDPHFQISPTVSLDVGGETVHLKPSFHWLNGRNIYYQKVSINPSRIEFTQKDVTSATWVLQHLKASFDGAETRALIKISDPDDTIPANMNRAASEYLGLLKKASDVVIDVDDEAQVDREFSRLLA